MSGLEYAIVKAVNSWGSGTWIDGFSILISSRLFLALLGILAALFILEFEKKKGKKVFVALLISVAIYYLFTEILIKDIIAGFGIERLRPYLAYPSDIFPLGNLNTDSSFPSAHMASLISFLFVLMNYYRKKLVWALSILAILLMGFSRMHNGMHYLSDIIFGVLFGIIYGYFAVRITDYFAGKNNKNKAKKKR